MKRSKQYTPFSLAASTGLSFFSIDGCFRFLLHAKKDRLRSALRSTLPRVASQVRSSNVARYIAVGTIIMRAHVFLRCRTQHSGEPPSSQSANHILPCHVAYYYKTAVADLTTNRRSEEYGALALVVYSSRGGSGTCVCNLGGARCCDIHWLWRGMDKSGFGEGQWIA